MKAKAVKEVRRYLHYEEAVLGPGWGVPLSWLIVLMPLALWLPRYSLTELWTSPGLYVTLAKIGSLTGTAMMGWSIILSARLHWLDKSFRGLDKMYRLHHQFGALAFTLILWHVFWLIVKFAVLGYGVNNLLFSHNPAYLMGELAFGLLLCLIFLTAMVRMPYHWFTRIHSWLGVMFIIGAAHAFMVDGQMAVNPPLRYYVLSLVTLSVAAFFYHSVFGQLLVRRYRYKVKDIHHLGDGVIEVCLARRGRPLLFAPGQFAYLSFEAPGLTESHPFSISSGNRESLIRFTIKDLGDYTDRLMKLPEGTKAKLEGPFGGFSYLNTRRKQQVWVAGGIGITPFLAMARSLRGKSYHVDLYYCTKNKAEAVFAGELAKLSSKQTGFHLVQICEDTDGFIGAATIAKVSGDLTQKDFLFCGPPVMTDALTKQLKEVGVTDAQIYLEDFRY